MRVAAVALLVLVACGQINQPPKRQPSPTEDPVDPVAGEDAGTRETEAEIGGGATEVACNERAEAPPYLGSYQVFARLAVPGLDPRSARVTVTMCGWVPGTGPPSPDAGFRDPREGFDCSTGWASMRQGELLMYCGTEVSGHHRTAHVTID